MTKSLDVSGGGDINRQSRPVVQRPLPRPQSVEPFFETHQIPLPNKYEDEYPRPAVVKDPEYAHVKKKPEREATQRPPVTPPRPVQPPKITEVKPKRPPPPATYVNIPPEPPVRPPAARESSPTMDPDEALLAAIRLATNLDPNMQAEQVIMNSS
jgi:hypothetical protein